MYPHQKTQINSIEEDFASIGLDAKKAIGTIDRQTELVEQRIGVSGKAAVGGDPPTLDQRTYGGLTEDADDVELDLDDDYDGGHDDDVFEEDRAYAPLLDLSDIDPSNQEEAVRVVKKKIKTAAEKLQSRLGRRKNKASNRKRSRMYAKKNKRKIARRNKLKLKKFGGRKGLAKARKRGRVMMQHADLPTDVSTLREDLNNLSTTDSVSDYLGPFEEAAHNAGWLAMLLGENFEAIGDEQSAETLNVLSDSASDLAEELEGIMDASDLSEDQEEGLRGILDGVVKGLRIYEALGAPSLGECFDYSEANLQG